MFKYFRRRPLLILLVITGFGLLPFVFSNSRVSLFHTTHRQEIYSGKIYDLTGNARITQEFLARYPGLNRIDIYFDRQNTENNNRVRFLLKTSCNAAEDLKIFEVPVSNIIAGEPYAFDFPPIDDSAGQRFCFMLEMFPSSDTTELGVYGTNADAYPDGGATYRPNTISTEADQLRDSVVHSPTHVVWLPIIERSRIKDSEEFDIGFQLYYRGRLDETINVLLLYLSAHKPYIGTEPGFYLILFIVYLAGLIFFWFLMSTTEPGQKL